MILPRDLGVEQNLDQVPAGHDELGHQVHVVVAVGPQRRRGLGALTELFIYTLICFWGGGGGVNFDII